MSDSNSPDTRSNSDQQHSLQIDQDSPDTTNTSSTDIQVHPNPVSGIDPKSIRIGNQSPAPETGESPIGTSPEAEAHERSPVSQQPANPPGDPLLAALWPSTDHFHQIGILDRQSNKFKNIPVKDAADAVAQALKLSSEGTEVYFACAEYLTPDSRVAANASGAWGFWMDIDCGEENAAAGKGYATVEDAGDALSKFCKDAGLPKPTHIVHSGGGLHVYWVLNA